MNKPAAFKNEHQKTRKPFQKGVSQVPKSTVANNFYIDTNHFDFSHSELAFVRKNVTNCYPFAFRRMIDGARSIMEFIQQNAEVKLNYIANLIFTEDRKNYRLFETLSNKNGILVSIINTPQKLKENARNHSSNGLNISYEMLRQFFSTVDDVDHLAQFHHVVGLNVSPIDLFKKIWEFIEQNKNHIFIYACSFPSDNNDAPENGIRMIKLCLGHTQTQSHMIEIKIPMKHGAFKKVEVESTPSEDGNKTEQQETSSIENERTDVVA